LAWQTVQETFRSVLQRDDVVAGMVAGIQTFGELIHFHPHLHAIVSDGAFTPEGIFLCLPPIETEQVRKRWEEKVFRLLLEEGKIEAPLVDQMRSWEHSGFSVDNSVYLPAGDVAGLERLGQYMVRCPLSLARVVRVTDSGSVVYRAEKHACRRFPKAASPDLEGGPRRNFQVFDALDYIAEVTQHIPDKGEQSTTTSRAGGLRKPSKRGRDHVLVRLRHDLNIEYRTRNVECRSTLQKVPTVCSAVNPGDVSTFRTSSFEIPCSIFCGSFVSP